MALLDDFPTVIDDAGDLTSGTVPNAALFAAIKAAVEENIHSDSNFLVKCKTIIDEVVAARGTAADLVSRLNITQDVDGSLLNGVVQRYHTNTTPASSVNAVETNLIQYTLPANTLKTNGQAVRVKAWGTTAANGNNKRVTAYWGATSMSFATHAGSASPWEIEFTVIRTGAATQVMMGKQLVDALGAPDIITASPTEVLSGSIVIKFSGLGTTTGDVVQSVLIVEVL